jgi:hypothetical protein
LTKRRPDVGRGPQGAAPKPTIASMRQRLGGLRELLPGAVGTEREGTLLSYRGSSVLVLHEDPGEGSCDLWLGDGRAVRAPIEELGPLGADVAVPPSLSRVADDFRLFLGLEANSSVRFLAGDGTIRDGKLVDRCKFGGLVALADGTVLGVGFARFLPPLGQGHPSRSDLHLS